MKRKFIYMLPNLIFLCFALFMLSSITMLPIKEKELDKTISAVASLQVAIALFSMYIELNLIRIWNRFKELEEEKRWK